jgi:hypothetical protein
MKIYSIGVGKSTSWNEKLFPLKFLSIPSFCIFGVSYLSMFYKRTFCSKSCCERENTKMEILHSIRIRAAISKKVAGCKDKKRKRKVKCSYVKWFWNQWRASHTGDRRRPRIWGVSWSWEKHERIFLQEKTRKMWREGVRKNRINQNFHWVHQISWKISLFSSFNHIWFPGKR